MISSSSHSEKNTLTVYLEKWETLRSYEHPWISYMYIYDDISILGVEILCVEPVNRFFSAMFK